MCYSRTFLPVLQNFSGRSNRAHRGACMRQQKRMTGPAAVSIRSLVLFTVLALFAGLLSQCRSGNGNGGGFVPPTRIPINTATGWSDSPSISRDGQRLYFMYSRYDFGAVDHQRRNDAAGAFRTGPAGPASQRQSLGRIGHLHGHQESRRDLVGGGQPGIERRLWRFQRHGDQWREHLRLASGQWRGKRHRHGKQGP